MIIFIALLLASVLSGCVTPITPEQLAAADYGQVPPTYKELIQQSMYNVLIDPESGRYRFFGEPVRGYAYIRGTINPPQFGYLVTVGINAKNRMGGYTGEQLYFFLIHNDAIWQLNEFTRREIVP